MTLISIVDNVKTSISETKADVKCEFLNFLQAGDTHKKLKLIEGTTIPFKLNGVRYLYKTKMDIVIDTIAALDTGNTLAAGKDYSVYLCVKDNNVKFVVSLNGTYPAGYSALTAYKIGGFHTECKGVTADNAPALKAGSFWTAHPAIGYADGDIIPNSIWCLTHRPVADPNGMVYIDRLGKWVDIYLQSGTGKNTTSAYAATITDSRQPILHQLDLDTVNKKMLTDNDFLVASEGSNQGTNITGSADPVTTGGHVDTAGKRMISGYFLEDCCGVEWQWLDELGFDTQTNWQSYGTNASDRGQSYGMPKVLLAGGNWLHGGFCGSWSRNCNCTRTHVAANSGCRGASLPLFTGKVA